jgi:ArsR family transcriptional regulator, arsenate/arsenite/antimonite-responsive transcriptional repressor / arsenate reductase (thioredoxin)
MNHEILTTYPSEFFKLIGHHIRWEILKNLSKSDLKVQELVEALNQPQNLVSYHLQLLNAHGLLRVSRSAADGREIYYSIELENLQRLYRTSGLALHPALLENDLSTFKVIQQKREKPISVLFLCTHNSARSQMAEGIIRNMSNGTIKVFSAGTEPSVVHPLAVRAMESMGIDIKEHTSKDIDQFHQKEFDYVITVCDKAREVCPIFPGKPDQIHWSFPDPAEVKGNETVRFEAFQKTALQLKTRIAYFLIMLDKS